MSILAVILIGLMSLVNLIKEIHTNLMSIVPVHAVNSQELISPFREEVSPRLRKGCIRWRKLRAVNCLSRLAARFGSSPLSMPSKRAV